MWACGTGSGRKTMCCTCMQTWVPSSRTQGKSWCCNANTDSTRAEAEGRQEEQWDLVATNLAPSSVRDLSQENQAEHNSKAIKCPLWSHTCKHTTLHTHMPPPVDLLVLAHPRVPGSSMDAKMLITHVPSKFHLPMTDLFGDHWKPLGQRMPLALSLNQDFIWCNALWSI